jgi:hypothetical protein
MNTNEHKFFNTRDAKETRGASVEVIKKNLATFAIFATFAFKLNISVYSCPFVVQQIEVKI